MTNSKRTPSRKQTPTIYRAETETPMKKTMKPATKSSMAAAATLLLTAGLTGCSGNLPSNFGVSTPTGGAKISGKVFGGQQPITGATIQLYTVGTSGTGSASTPMLTTTVQTDASGNFTITGDYSCAGSSATQVYITSTGGNPGAGGVNTAANLMAALGPCSSLSSSTYIYMNELTTVAAAYALAPFTADYLHVGATGSNPTGLVNAFTTAQTLVNTATATPGQGDATGVTVPTAEINTLGNILAACINSASSGSTACSTLFSATGASETFGAALAMAKNPGTSATTGLYTLSSSNAPFQPTLASQPKDFSVAITMAGPASTLSTPYALAIDASGNAWVTNEASNSFVGFSPAGAVLATGSDPNMYEPEGIAIDRNGAIWVAGTAQDSLYKYTYSASTLTQVVATTTANIAVPVALAVDSGGNVFIANSSTSASSVAAFDTNGNELSGSPYTSASNLSAPVAIAVNGTGQILVTSTSGSLVKFDKAANAGTYLASYTDNALQGPTGVAYDSSTGDVAIAGFTTGASVGGGLSEFTSAGASEGGPYTAGFTGVAGVAASNGVFYAANGTGSGASLLVYTRASGVPTGPATGLGSLNAPQGVAVDPSGNVWVANSGNNTLVVYVGLAAPVKTPLAANVGP